MIPPAIHVTVRIMSPKFVLFCLASSLLLRISRQVSTPNSTSYVAAVVEFSPTYRRNDGPGTLTVNTDAYVRHIRTAAKQDADIVVFPEDGLTSVGLPDRSKMDAWATEIPSASDDYVPCTGSDARVSQTLEKLSCAARENRIYVVVNIAEKFSEHDRQGRLTEPAYYNTNVVFDRDGKVVARYRKANLFEEPQFNVTAVPEVVTFDTDFGVRFGTITCFDILFDQPALNLTRLAGATDIAYPTAWFSEAPFLTAVQTQRGWSFAENVNLLAAGYSRPEFGNTGTGIYLGRDGTVGAFMSREAHDRLLIGRVPKLREVRRSNGPPVQQRSPNRPSVTSENERAADGQRRSSNESEIKLLRDNFEHYASLPLEGRTIERTICHGSLCCDFLVETDNLDRSSEYRLAAYDGLRFYGTQVEAGIRVCGLIQCANRSVLSCGSVLDSETTFRSLRITARFDLSPRDLVMPSVLSSSLLPLDDQSFSFSIPEADLGSGKYPRLALAAPRKNLVAFAIYARDFDRDL